MINKEQTSRSLICSSEAQSENEIERNIELKKSVKHEAYSLRKSWKETWGTGCQRKNRDHRDHSSIKICKNT